MFWTLGSGVQIWTAFEAVLFWALADGHMRLLTFEATPVWFVALFVLIPVCESFFPSHSPRAALAVSQQAHPCPPSPKPQRRHVHAPGQVDDLPGAVLMHLTVGLEIPWDQWFGSVDDGTGAASERMQARRKRIMGR